MKRTRREREAVHVTEPVPATGWKPRVWWLLKIGRGKGDAYQGRRYRCATIEEARERGKEFLRVGWSWAWVEEQTSRTKTTRG